MLSNEIINLSALFSFSQYQTMPSLYENTCDFMPNYFYKCIIIDCLLILIFVTSFLPCPSSILVENFHKNSIASGTQMTW